ncbi:exonuclease domain-containing protein [Canibacter zhoujuaniae]|uniref:exonuclease domain-containing protein n=1 Tax=Canibacter zhoujuaniae TaxID=2708343 RepID=UPI001424A1A5|nr:exonuclease domain-containing protein [Canibacter zhoujuaniae]
MSQKDLTAFKNFIAFDTETTGIDTAASRIVSASATVFAAGEAQTTYDWLINPGVPIPEQASRVHGITTEIAERDGQHPAEAITEIVALLNSHADKGYAILAYNAPFDLSILKSETKRYGLLPVKENSTVFDPLVLDKHFWKYRKGKRTLEVTCEHYGITLSAAHTADADALAAGLLMLAMLEKFGDADDFPKTPAELHTAQVRWAVEQAADFEAYLHRIGKTDAVISGTWPVK